MFKMKNLGWLVLAALVAYFIFLIRQDIIDNLDLKKEEQRLTRKNQEQQAQSVELSLRLKELKNTNLTEELARTRLGWIKKGETAYKVIL